MPKIQKPGSQHASKKTTKTKKKGKRKNLKKATLQQAKKPKDHTNTKFDQTNQFTTATLQNAAKSQGLKEKEAKKRACG